MIDDKDSGYKETIEYEQRLLAVIAVMLAVIVAVIGGIVWLLPAM